MTKCSAFLILYHCGRANDILQAAKEYPAVTLSIRPLLSLNTALGVASLKRHLLDSVVASRCRRYVLSAAE